MPLAYKADQQTATIFDFQKLERLRLFSKQILADQLTSLKYFAHSYGFKHLETSKGISVASSATCVLSLVATDSWRDYSTKARSKSLLKSLIKRRTSADLVEDNPFTLAWILETVTVLEEIYPGSIDPRDLRRVARNEKILQNEIRRGSGGVSIAPYPASAYLTQLVVRVLDQRSKLTDQLKKAVNKWAWAELARQLALVQSKSKTADPFAVAYLLMLVTALTQSSKTDPEQTSIQRTALKTFFECQRDDGTWPLSRPLFHYPQVGSAYCYEYEMLIQLLQQEELQDLLLEHLSNLSLAVESISNSVYRVGGDIRTWTSGHHPQKGGPESWATASVYHFFHVLDRLVTEAVRRELFHYLGSSLPAPTARRPKRSDFAKELLDSTVRVKGKQRSLKEFLWEKFAKPLWTKCDGVLKGRTLGERTPRSAIFFGPPGTSKTALSQKIADFLGWPLLAIDPSHLLRNGMDGIQAEANAIFRMLEQTERVVVLFDEFDELVLERGSPRAETFSRFLTTAMLPKLASIHSRATLVFIIATNNIGDFDLAIRRQGRFDLVLQIMPPTFKAKMVKKDWGSAKLNLAAKFRKLGVKLTPEIRQQVGDLTYAECDAFASGLANVSDKQEAINALADHWKRCTLQTRVSKAYTGQEGEITWAERCRTESAYNYS
jgi:transcription termination factor NusB